VECIKQISSLEQEVEQADMEAMALYLQAVALCQEVQANHIWEDVTAWLPRPGIRTYIFLTRLPTLLSRSVTSYLALYP